MTLLSYFTKVTEVKVADCYEDPEEVLQKKSSPKKTNSSGVTAAVCAAAATASAVTSPSSGCNSGSTSSSNSGGNSGVTASSGGKPSPPSRSTTPNAGNLERRSSSPLPNRSPSSSSPKVNPARHSIVGKQSIKHSEPMPTEIDIKESSTVDGPVVSSSPKVVTPISGSPGTKSKVSRPNSTVVSQPNASNAAGGKGTVYSKGASVYSTQKSSSPSSVCPIECKPKFFSSDPDPNTRKSDVRSQEQHIEQQNSNRKSSSLDFESRSAEDKKVSNSAVIPPLSSDKRLSNSSARKS